ncbi:MAG: YbfB/YjiJ family MFS transporter, partial [Bacilli bacterium]
IGRSIDASALNDEDNTLKANDHREIVYKNQFLWVLGLFYMLWGFSYIIFTTFLVDYFIHDIGLNEHLAGRIFAIAGLISVISGFLWGAISDHIGRMISLSILFFFQMALLISFSLTENSMILLIETIAYSTTLWAIPAIIIAASGDLVGMTKASAAIGFLTLFFGIGQLIAPIMIGYVVEINGSYFFAFLLSSTACLAAGLGCIRMHYYMKTKSFYAKNNNLIETAEG